MAPTRTVVLTLCALALVGCGEDDPVAAPTTTPAAVTTAAATGYDVATGADDVVLSLTNEGGFVMAGTAFANAPLAMVTGDGLAISTGAIIMIFPGPLLPNILQRTITPAAVQELLSRADELGLLAEVTYASDPLIADAATTVLSITVDGTTYRHEADALGIDEDVDPARDALEQFVAELSDLSATVGAAELGPEEAFVGDTFLIQATPVDPATITVDGAEPTFAPWPAAAGARLLDAAACAEVPAAAVASLLADADVLTFFTEPDPTDGAEVTYQVSAIPRLPGRSC